ncbi:MAG TPA: Na-translocating system protein MpsC family protein [Actinomycetota bacterium]|jgi:uncharacterized protein YbcI|nr:Na-translocating system protein MpsC family protein [Actinomycetota bacterium]
MAEESTQQAEAVIANEISRVQGEYYGLAPAESRAFYIPGHAVMVVLPEPFTPAEKVMIQHGAGPEIQNMRRRFQQINADQFISIVEQATGETVASFLSETNISDRVSVEVFLLGPPRTDMESFEEAEIKEPEET